MRSLLRLGELGSARGFVGVRYELEKRCEPPLGRILNPFPLQLQRGFLQLALASLQLRVASWLLRVASSALWSCLMRVRVARWALERLPALTTTTTFTRFFRYQKLTEFTTTELTFVRLDSRCMLRCCSTCRLTGLRAANLRSIPRRLACPRYVVCSVCRTAAPFRRAPSERPVRFFDAGPRASAASGPVDRAPRRPLTDS